MKSGQAKIRQSKPPFSKRQESLQARARCLTKKSDRGKQASGAHKSTGEGERQFNSCKHI